MGSNQLLCAFRNVASMRLLVTALAALAAAPFSQSQELNQTSGPEAEFHMARLIHGQVGSVRGNFRRRPWWAIDYPAAEYHLTRGLRRLTRLDVADDSIHLQSIDERIFDHPWLFAQQVGHWQLSVAETERLREYLLRGGFMVVDDFHGAYEWATFTDVIRRVLPGKPIIDIPDTDPLLHVLYDLDQRTQIPGRRHLYRGAGGQIVAQLPGGPPHWRGIYDDEGRLLVAINYNMDMGDAWEHADDPVYPEPMTALAYRFGINYIIYAMTH
jgi:hypothetical protein